MRRCALCGVEQPLEDFPIALEKPKGRRYRCKTCYNSLRRKKPQPPISVLSLGAGVQSTALLLMSKAGELPPLDYAIFADTGMEPQKVYDNLDWLESVSHIPVIRVRRGSLGEKPFALPLFTAGEGTAGILQRQCTYDFKIAPIRGKIWELVGKSIYGRVKQAIGISWDEAHRMSDSGVNYIEHVYPLVDARITRQDCLDWMEEKGYPEPPRSACVVCPYRSDIEWMSLTDEELLRASQFDKSIRQAPKLNYETFLHSQRVPLAKVHFKTGKNEGNFANECSGMCGV